MSRLAVALAILLVAGVTIAQSPRTSAPPRPPVTIPSPRGESAEDDPAPGPTLAQLAADSTWYRPKCEPPGPTPGLWGDDQSWIWPHSWQEGKMCIRDALTWVFTWPSCSDDAHPSPDVSAWAWATQWLPSFGSSTPDKSCPRE